VIKLNGQIYLDKPQVFCIIDECIDSIKKARYYKISPAIGDITSDIKNQVFSELNKFRAGLEYKCSAEKYIRFSFIHEYITQQTHDPRKVKVGKYQQGAFGIRLNADPDAVVRYVFNVCMKVIATSFSGSI
jgi:hypothetical protein